MDERWVWVCIAVSGGVLCGAILGVILRRLLDRDDRRPAVREVATPLSLFAFWVLTATGILVAISLSSPETLTTIPADVLDWLPNVALAGLIVIGGYALALTLATTVGRAAARASGARQRGVERAVRGTIVSGAMILALSQLGANTTVLNILIAGVVFGIAGTLVGIATIGSRDVAANVAAGRTLQQLLAVGNVIRVDGVTGRIVELHASHLAIETDEGLVLLGYALVLRGPITLVSDD